MATKQELEEMLEDLEALHNGVVDILSDTDLTFKDRVDKALERLSAEVIGDEDDDEDEDDWDDEDDDDEDEDEDEDEEEEEEDDDDEREDGRD